MWINWKRFTCGALLLAASALLLSGCSDLGGGGTVTASTATTKTISGVVSDPATGLPMSGVKVQAVAIAADGTEGATPISVTPTTATTTEQGRYTLHIPIDYNGSVMVVGDVSSGVVRTLARLLAGQSLKSLKAAVPQSVVSSSTIPPVMLSFATNTLVEFVKKNNSGNYSPDNVRKATATLEKFFGPNFTQIAPPSAATAASASKAQQDLMVVIKAMNAVISATDSTATIESIVSSMVGATGLGSVADDLKKQIHNVTDSLQKEGTLPPEYQPSPAINAAITNAQSAPVTVDLSLLNDTAPPTVPAGLKGAAAAARRVDLSWSPSSDSGQGSTGVAGYLVCRAEAGSDNFTVIDSVPAASAPAYADLSAVPQTGYSYKIVAFDGAHNLSDGSAPVAVTTPAAVDSTPPSIPASLNDRGTTTSKVALLWQPSFKTFTDGTSVPATKYNVYRDYQLIATVTDPFFTDATVSAGTAYNYFVKAADADGNLSAASPLLAVRTPLPAGTGPQAPGALSVAASASDSVTLQWGASATPGATYNVYRYGTQVASGITGTSYSDLGLTPVSSYVYTVSAVSQGVESAASAPISVNTLTSSSHTDGTVPAVPRNLTATVASASVSLNWTAADTVAVGYQIWRSTSGATPVQIATVTSLSFTDSTPQPGTSYSYLVAAYSASGKVSDAAMVAIGTPAAVDLSDTTPPTAPTALGGSADPINGVVSLSWSASTKSTGDKVVAAYLVYRNGLQLAQVTSTSFTDSSVASSVSYTYYVKAIDTPGNISDASNSVTITTPAPTPNSYFITGRVTLNGIGVAGALVNLTGDTTQSVAADPNGYYTFSQVGNGSYTVTPATGGGFLYTPASRSVSVSGARVGGQDFSAVISGAVIGGVTYPQGTIVGGITYPTGSTIGGVYYPTATVVGGVTYPTGTVIGGISFPNGVVIGGVSYPAGTVVGGIAFPVGAVTTGYSWPTGTVLGGVVYPTGNVIGGILYPTGGAGVSLSFPMASLTGGYSYPSGVVVGSQVYPTGVVSGALSFPTGGAVGVILYPTGSATGGYSYPTGLLSAGVIYPTGTVGGGATYPSSGLTAPLSYPSGSLASLLTW